VAQAAALVEFSNMFFHHCCDVLGSDVALAEMKRTASQR
jgi:hypothetical protein